MNESVTVDARVGALQSASGERSYTLEETAIGNIAVNGRSFFGLVGLVLIIAMRMAIELVVKPGEMFSLSGV